MKKLALYLLASVLVSAACTGGNAGKEATAPADTVPVMVMQIRKCSRLYTAEYQVRKIITHDDKVELKGSLFDRKFNVAVPMSERKIAIPVDAKLKAYVDFSGFSEKNVSVRGGKVEITLPDPKVELTSTRVDHDGIRRHVPLIRSNFTDAEMAGYERQGREAIIKSIPQTGIIDMARAGATHALVPLLARLGFKEEDITITFRKEFTAEDMPLLLENTTIENGRQ